MKITADYSSCDPSQMDAWLMKILPDLSQYTYEMLKAGMNKEVLASTNNEELDSVCGIKNGIHRRLILEHVEGESSMLLFRLNELQIHACIIIKLWINKCLYHEIINVFI